MDFPKISSSFPSPSSENIHRLAQLFPSVIKDGQVDFHTLKAELGLFEEIDKEHYELTWAGKQQSMRVAGEAIRGRTPYNTGHDFVYRDNFTVSATESDRAEGLRDGEGERLVANPKTSARYHANWLSMMYPRLRLAKNLLSDDGVIFISSDDNEVGNLREICDEIFGEENFRNIIFTRRYDKNLNLQFTKQGLLKMNTGLEYILIYSKSQSTKYNPVFRGSSNERSSTGYWKGFWNDLSLVGLVGKAILSPTHFLLF